MKTIYNCL